MLRAKDFNRVIFVKFFSFRNTLIQYLYLYRAKFKFQVCESVRYYNITKISSS